MRDRDPMSELRRILARKGFSRRYANRAAREVEDHRRDLIEEGLHHGLSAEAAEVEATQRLGDVATLAEDFALRMRSASWLARNPTLAFAVFPLVLILVWWAIWFGGSVALVGALNWSRGISWWNLSDAALLKVCADWTRLSGYIVLPALVCHVAARYFCGWQAALWGCLILALHNAAHSFRIETTPADGAAIWAYSFSLRGPALAPMAMPLLIFAACYFWNLRRETYESKLA